MYMYACVYIYRCNIVYKRAIHACMRIYRCTYVYVCVRKFMSAAHTGQPDPQWRITVFFSNYVGLVYLAIQPPSLETALGVLPSTLAADYFTERPGPAQNSKCTLGLYTILPLPILYGVWHKREKSVGGRILRNGRAIVLKSYGQYRWGAAITG